MTESGKPEPRMAGPWQWLDSRRGELGSVAGVVSGPVVNMIAGIALIRSLTPAQVGTINLATLWPAYLGFLHLGALTGMARQLPLFLGAGENRRAEVILEATSSIVWRASVAGALICAVLAALLGWMKGDALLGWALLAGSVTVLSANVTLRVDTILRSYGRFGRYGFNQIASNAVALATVPLIVMFGATGAVVRLVVAGMSALLVRIGNGYGRNPVTLDWQEARELIAVGFPLLISSMLFTFLLMADRSVVALTLTRQEVGYFSLASIVATSMQFLPQALSMIVFPKMARLYGAAKDPVALRPLVIRTLWINALTVVPLSVAAYFLLPMAITHWFPAYLPGVRAGQIACLTGIFWVYLGVGSVFGVTNRMRAYLTVLAICLVLVWLGGWLLIRAGCGIEGAALARLGATAVICVFTIWSALRLTSVSGKQVSHA